MKKLKAAVVGLGNTGFRFNLDPLREATWSHTAAYERCARTGLAGAVEIDSGRMEAFKEHYRDVPVYRTVSELMENSNPDIVSVCTPTDTHYAVLKDIVEHPVKAVFCEKPLAWDIASARRMVRLCKDKGVVLAVNHNRRWNSNYLYVKKLIQNGAIGKVMAVNAFYPGEVFNIGTHLFDVLRMLLSKDAASLSGFSENAETSDPSVSGWIRFKGGLPCTVITAGKNRDLIFEIDIIGEKGRVKITDNGSRVKRYSFRKSGRYSGYRELLPLPEDKIALKDRFVETMHDIARVVEGGKDRVNCSGFDALTALSMSLAMLRSARLQGRPLKPED